MERTVFIVRLAQRDADGSWRGEIELVGSDERTGLSGPTQLVEFIERRIVRVTEGGTSDER